MLSIIVGLIGQSQYTIIISYYKFKLNMRMSLPTCIIILLCLLSQYSVQCYGGCTGTNSSLPMGCLKCDLPADSLAYNTSQSKFTCTSITDCILMQQSTCKQCGNMKILDVANNNCTLSPGCAYFNITCTSCSSNYVLLGGVCYLKQIQYCTKYILNGSILGCSQCMYPSMSPAQNCSFNASTCEVFDYTVMKCVQCPNNTVIHSQAISCYQPISNCLVYDTSESPRCLLCQSNYIYHQSNNGCELGQSLGISQQILTYDPTTLAASYSYKCLNNQQQINMTDLLCSINATSHRLNSSDCIPGYYPSNAQCRQCSIVLSNCAMCKNAVSCSACDAGYYLLNTTSVNKCMPCSSYGCLLCISNFDTNNKVKCLSCPINTTLYAGSCISCQNTSSAYSVTESKCLPCNSIIPNCSFCKHTDSPLTLICLQCTYGYYFNGTLCLSISNSLLVTYTIAKQVLKKSAPTSDKVLYNDKNGLMSSCNSTDGFICRCASVSLTSLCNTFPYSPNISTLIFNTTQLIAQYPDQLRMAAEFPAFNIATNVPLVAFEAVTLYQFWNLLSAYSFCLIRGDSATAIISKIFSHTAAMTTVFSDQKITILRGNGFYYKYIPVGLASGGLGDDDYINTTLSSTSYVVIYAYYSRLLNDNSGLLSGTTYLYTPNTQTDFNVTFRKTRYSNTSTNLTVKVNSVQSNYNTTLSGGYFVVKGFPKSTLTVSSGVQIYGSGSSTTVDLYESQRIENIFYSESWLYILFFIALYLIFIPLCAIVDCCEAEQSMRKKIGTEQSDNKESQSEETIVKVNYRDFFPLYNVGNTPRPRRLAKVCLFIVNTEHIVTFLTLCYFNLAGGLPIVAIVLMIPAYLCTVVMGYIIGAIFRALPGNFKFLINILSLGYFILWFFLMRIMTTSASKEYRLFIVVFSVLSFFLDLVIDGFETLAVYFSIRQENQVALFQCLAKWLSLRGYYQFDKLAKQIDGGQ